MDRLLGDPLNKVIDLVGEGGFSMLYGTGNKLLCSRIKKCPLRCEWRVNPFSSNVISVNLLITNYSSGNEPDKFYTEFREHQKSWQGTSKYKRAMGKNPIPTTLTDVTIVIPNYQWPIFLPFLSHITKLDVRGYGGDDRANILKLPLGITDLTLHRYDESQLLECNLKLSSLRLLDFNKGYQHRHDYVLSMDLTKFPLTTFEVRWKNNIILPPTITDLKDTTKKLNGEYPDLVRAEVESIKGTYNRLRFLKVFDFASNYSTCSPVHVEVIDKDTVYKSKLHLNAKYIHGHLRSEWSHLRDFKRLAVTSISIPYSVDDNVVEEQVRMMAATYPLLKKVHFEKARSFFKLVVDGVDVECRSLCAQPANKQC